MKKLLIASTIAIALTTGTSQLAFAKNKQNENIPQTGKNELIGFGSGAVAGAAIGGPIGAVIGGIFGLFIADDINTDTKLAQTNAQLTRAQHDLQEKSKTYATLQQNYKSLQKEQMMQLVSFEKESNDAWLSDFSGFETNLQFKTASFLVEDTYNKQLDSLASLLNNYPQLSVNVTGYADQRGDSKYNQVLSTQRAQAVKSYLLSKQVKTKQIMVVGAGETNITTASPTSVNTNTTTSASKGVASPASLNIEDLFFERRVNISLTNTNTALTAAN